jgi:uncharacterized membrane protein YhaH (DUF805 family)
LERFRQYFSFRGRTGRTMFWATFVVASVALFIAASVSVLIATVSTPLAWAFDVAMTPILVIWVAVMVRRLHDRNRTGWWAPVLIVLPSFLSNFAMGAWTTHALKDQAAMFLVIVALLIWGWGLVDLGILRGTVGSNRYGEDPVGAAA